MNESCCSNNDTLKDRPASVLNMHTEELLHSWYLQPLCKKGCRCSPLDQPFAQCVHCTRSSTWCRKYPFIAKDAKLRTKMYNQNFPMCKHSFGSLISASHINCTLLQQVNTHMNFPTITIYHAVKPLILRPEKETIWRALHWIGFLVFTCWT